MTPLRKFFRRFAEKALERWYEGPDPPARLREIPVDFANHYPNATRRDWARFAAEHAAEAYRRGYARGYEWAEREPARGEGELTPEQIADRDDPDWRWSPDIAMVDPLGIVEAEELPEGKLLERHIEEMRRGGPEDGGIF